jgi:hydroxyacylglutathione hydrolase
MQVVVIPVTPYQQNCSLLRCPVSGEAAVIDPGGDIQRILEAAARADARISKILLTHGHFDHAGAAAELAEQLGVAIEGPHRDDLFLLQSLPEWCSQVGFPPCRAVAPDRWLGDGDEVSFGEEHLEVLHCPGHTPGHVVFFHRPDRLAIVGDVLFRGSIGRTDFPRGDHAALLASIRHKLWPLGDDVTFLPGHGPRSTFGAERRSNPFVRNLQPS